MTSASFQFSPDAVVSHVKLGSEGETLLAIDHLLAEPMELVRAAAEAEFTPAHGPGGGYPGIRAPAPLDYVGKVSRAILPLLVAHMGLPPSRLVRAECNFSLVTMRPDALVDAQREPHVDTTDGWHFAILHYLCSPDWGGTGFYRHRATGFETLRPERMDAFAEARRREGPEGAGYVTGDTGFFEQIGKADAAFNRLIAYRSRQLHSGQIMRPAALVADPLRGRLTANIFLTLRQDTRG